MNMFISLVHVNSACTQIWAAMLACDEKITKKRQARGRPPGESD